MDPEHASVREPRASRASHREIADELRSRIGSGALRPGQRMPTQAELAEEFGVERGAVRQALDILHAERLLTGVSKGSPARVAEGAWPGWSAAPPQPTVVGLGPRVAAAFAAPEVRIDALCLTSVSLTLAVGEQLRLIHAGELKPAKIDVRVLLPSHRIELAFPTPVDPVHAGDGGLLHERWLAVRNAQGLVLRQNLLALRTTHGIDVRLTFRALPFTPRSSSTCSTRPRRCSRTTPWGAMSSGSSAGNRSSCTTRTARARCCSPSGRAPGRGMPGRGIPGRGRPKRGTPPSWRSPGGGSTRCGRRSAPIWS